MTIAIERPGLVVHQGDALAVLRTLGSESVHAICTSPPYYAKYGGIITVKGVRDMGTYHCELCGKDFTRRGEKPGRFCSIACKADWQRTRKPVDRAWLEQQYVVEGRSTYQIAKIVHRNPKQVYEWLRGYGIPTRERTWSNEPGGSEPYKQEEWLRREYLEKARSTEDIAAEFGITGEAITFHLRQFSIARRSVAEARAVKHWSLPGAMNGMFGRRGADVPSWRGGVTPERQALYRSPEWIEVAKAVWKRDRGTCRRCGLLANDDKRFDIHHIVSFAVRELRAEPTNLVLLCRTCHRFVHSRKNVAGEFIAEKGGDANGAGA